MGFASEFMGLPGLRGYWPMGSFDSSGNAIDQSGQNRSLTYNGNPTYNVVTTYNAPYLDLDGTGDYLSRTDEAGLDIVGTESYVATAARGLTLGGWFYFDRLTADEHLSGKLGASGQFSYRLAKASVNIIKMTVSSNGTATTDADSSGTVTTATWYFLAGRFIPSTELAVFINTTKTVNTTSIPSAAFGSTAEFRIGNDNGAFGQILDGRASNCFLCAEILSDALLTDLYNNTKAYYGL